MSKLLSDETTHVFNEIVKRNWGSPPPFDGNGGSGGGRGGGGGNDGSNWRHWLPLALAGVLLSAGLQVLIFINIMDSLGTAATRLGH